MAKNANRVVLESYAAFGLESLAHNQRDLARIVVSRRDQERRLAGPKRPEVLLDRSFPQCFTIGDLFNDSMMLQLFPAGPEPAGLHILDCGFQCGYLLSLRLE